MKKPDLGIDQFEYNRLVEHSYLSPDELEKISKVSPRFFIENGRIKVLLTGKKAEQNICIIDSINFTFKLESIHVPFRPHAHIDNDEVRLDPDKQLFSDYLIELSRTLEKIFGFGITHARNNGAYYYAKSYELGNAYGLVCIGGQNDTVLVSLMGTGCNQASEGWESRLYEFLNNCVQASITRIDLAHDDFEGTRYNLDYCLKQYQLGAFTSYRKPPKISQVGNWLTPDDKGRTIYIGSRESDKYLRIYEKGKQLESSEQPNWVRAEVEFHSRDTIIDFEVLMQPHQYFAAAYPIFNDLNSIHHRFETIQHEVKADIEHRIFHAKRQTGAVINLLAELGYSPQQIIDTLKKDKLPTKFVQRFLENPFRYVHEDEVRALIEHQPTHAHIKD